MISRALLNKSSLSTALLAALGFTLSFAAPVTAHAAQTTQTTSQQAAPEIPPSDSVALKLDQNFTYDSNPLKLTSHVTSIYGSETMLSLLLKGDGPTSTVRSNSQVQRNYYNNSDFDSTNFFETLNLGKQNERFAANFDGKVDYATTRTTELTSFGISAPSIRNTQLTARPSGSFQFSPVSKIALKTRVTHSTYDSNAYQDYDVYGLAPVYERKLDPKNTGTLTWNMERYETQGASKTTTDTQGPSLGWIWLYDDNLTARFTAGMEKSEQDQKPGNKKKSQNFSVFSGNFEYKAEQFITNFDASRAQQPSGNGVTYLLTSLGLNEIYVINDRVSLRGGAQYRSASYITNPGINLDHEYNGSLGFAYRMIDDVDLTGNYQYVQQKLTGRNGLVKENVVLFGVTYHPSEWGF